ncbi:hypothetical protein [Helicobacter sp. MIT 01-3238]|uniref:hypothetical protein n=1 Tax=Helicobacter sp. MIT 01-3238 TaxID=398627 RepID=UPI000E1F5056|nr:hypothetical protein [Helicobacter sp. MIT 01-3238]RDU51788.1 hypothetical protein CQA40_09030 [Helicobacter sp. MIT 01-3238]
MKLQDLQNHILQEITLFNGVLGLEIGENITQYCENGKEVVMPNFSLEVQSTYRFIQNKEIIFGSYESLFFDSKDKLVWILQDMCPTMIEDISISKLDDIFVDFANGLRLEVFNDTNASKRNYRIYDNTKSANYDEAFFDKARNYIEIEKRLIRNL